MSVLEQLLFAVLGVTILAASLALSDPNVQVALALRNEPATQYTLQSCSSP
jgi:hypothetical protein